MSLLMINIHCQESGFAITRMAGAKQLNKYYCLEISATKRIFVCGS